MQDILIIFLPIHYFYMTAKMQNGIQFVRGIQNVLHVQYFLHGYISVVYSQVVYLICVNTRLFD